MTIERKITKIGKSYGVTIPMDMLKENGIQLGDLVEISSDDGKISIQQNRKVTLPDGISPDFFDVLLETNKKHDKALKGLVDR